jgi:hypothetical protein
MEMFQSCGRGVCVLIQLLPSGKTTNSKCTGKPEHRACRFRALHTRRAIRLHALLDKSRLEASIRGPADCRFADRSALSESAFLYRHLLGTLTTAFGLLGHGRRLAIVLGIDCAHCSSPCPVLRSSQPSLRFGERASTICRDWVDEANTVGLRAIWRGWSFFNRWDEKAGLWRRNLRAIRPMRRMPLPAKAK